MRSIWHWAFVVGCCAGMGFVVGPLMTGESLPVRIGVLGVCFVAGIGIGWLADRICPREAVA